MTVNVSELDMQMFHDQLILDLQYNRWEVLDSQWNSKSVRIEARKSDIKVIMFITKAQDGLMAQYNVRRLGAICISKAEIEYNIDRLKRRYTRHVKLPPYKTIVTVMFIPSEESKAEICADLEAEIAITKLASLVDATRLAEIFSLLTSIWADEEYDRIIANKGR